MVSFLRHGYAGEPPRERWSWADVHDANARVDWAAWTTHGLPVSPLLS